ncbi:hypothetical protein MMC07_001864 [Pseudocyphellaria aurata]|nr:hypothetical protein [Pseudocyphellaria aurata]
MSLNTDSDGSEDVNDFLLRIRELGEKRDKEDKERTRKLEEDILQGRKEREARRAERARSLSPTKSSPNAGTPHSMRSPLNIPDETTNSPVDFQQSTMSRDIKAEGPNPPRGSEVMDYAGSPRNMAQKPAMPADSSNDSPSVATIPKRAGTLSWQQRPQSRPLAGARSHPLSMVNTEGGAVESLRANASLSSAKDTTLSSRNQIAKSLEAKNPDWFKQTEDRGSGSAAYRRNKEDNLSDMSSYVARKQLPGLSRETSQEPEKSSPPRESGRSLSPSVQGSSHVETSGIKRYSSSASNSSLGGVRSPLPTLSSQRFQPPSSDTISSPGEESSSVARTLAMSPSQGRISPERFERPQSPTKGLGGFVQSAMLKRSDSVNKRWSAQPTPGLSRGNSIASNRSGYDGSRQAIGSPRASKDFRSISPERENSPLSYSRPGSSHSTATVTQTRTEQGLSTESKFESNPSEGFVKPALPPLQRSQSVKEKHEGHNENHMHSPTPTSPGKKWSPSKASWLENAINKPDSPKPKVLPPQKPNWMVDINKAKQHRASVDVGKPGAFKDLAGGLVRSSSPETPNKLLSIEGSLKRPRVLPTANASERNLEEDAQSKDILAEAETADHQEIPPTSLTASRDLRFEVESLSKNKPTSASKQDPSNSLATSTEGLQVRSRLGSPSVIKPRPRTPPKKDFRSTLKSRPISDGKDDHEESEFKSVFGKLKRTQTQNYVAPDEFKDNILRGKAGLTMTGGPQKTERKDELKESILKQKEAMKGGTPPGVPRKPTGFTPRGESDAPAPEAIAKMMALTRPESALSNPSTNSREEVGRSPIPGEGTTEIKPMRNKPKPELSDKEASGVFSKSNEPAKTKAGNQFSSSLAGLLSRGPSPTASGSKPSVSMNPNEFARDALISVSKDDVSDSGPQLTHITKTRARGPKRRLPATGKSQSTTEHADPTSRLEPEMKSPVVESRKPSFMEKPSPVIDRLEARPLSNISNNNRKSSQPLSPRKPSKDVSLVENVKPASSKSKSPSKESAPSHAKTSPVVKQKPALIVKDDQTRISSISSSPPPVKAPQKPLQMGELPPQMPATKIERTEEQELQDKEVSVTSVKDVAAVWGKSSSTEPARAKSPIKLPTRNDKENALESAGNIPVGTKEPIGLGIQTASKENRSRPLDPNLPSPPMRSPKSPPLPRKNPALIASRVPATTSPSQPIEQDCRSQIQLTSDRLRLLVNFFGQTSSSQPKVNVDTQSVLASCSSHDGSDKIKTLRKQIYEITGGGRLLPVPSQQEHILFEENLYLCTHVFGTAAGTRTTEVYLWYGEGVAPSAAEDAQLFARKVAKENNGKLIILQQGKETSNFFQALGGIVIIRRGSGSRGDSPSKTSATYMLCGRRHVGQIAFDEVDFSARSLCSAFPYIVSARFGKLYLWKGRGSGAEELGCARLIGMDLGLTGEIEEVDEGREPSSFWESLPGGKSQDVAMAGTQHWHLKPSFEKYVTRLFGIDLEPPRPKSSSSSFIWGRRGSAPLEENSILNAQVHEILPFTQKDIRREGFFVLDSFFEVFVIVSSSATRPSRPSPSTSLISSSAQLRASIVFAQEYATLAASLEDRPFVSTCSVVFMPALPGDENATVAPVGLTSSFRRWDDGSPAWTYTILEAGEVRAFVGI